MSDPTYEVYSGTMRFDDDNIVDVNLQPDTENINVRLNGTEVTIGAELPAVTAADNGDVLTVVEGAWAKAEPASQLPSVSGSDNGNLLTVVEGSWAKAAPASQLPAVSGSDNGNVLTVVEGAWAKAAPAGGGANVFVITLTADTQSLETAYYSDKTFAQIVEALENGDIIQAYYDNGEDQKTLYPLYGYLYSGSDITNVLFQTVNFSTNYVGCSIWNISSSAITVTDYDVTGASN